MSYTYRVCPREDPWASLPEDATMEQVSATGEAWRDWREDYPIREIERTLRNGRHLADALLAVGAGFEARDWVDPGEFPQPEQYGCHYSSWDGRTVGARADEFERAVADYLIWHGPEIPGIPIHKVCESNDAWRVTKAECQAAVQLYEFAMRNGKEHPHAFGDDFMPFLREAASRDGFETS